MGNKSNLWNLCKNAGAGAGSAENDLENEGINEKTNKKVKIVPSANGNGKRGGDFAVSVSGKGDRVLENFEDVLDTLGGFGKFQFMTLALLLSIEIPCAFFVFNVFITAPPKEWTCVDIIENNETSVSVLNSSSACQCNGSLVSYSDHSIISEWMLICDASWVSDFITSIQMVGTLFGNIYAGSISDSYGRKYACIGNLVLMAVGQVLSAVANNSYVYAAARFIGGAGFAGCLGISAIYAMEFNTPKYRQLSSSVGPFGESVMLLALMAYFIRPWRLLLWATSIPLPILLVIIPFIPESPRWLLRNNRVKEAHEVTKQIARWNGKSEDLISLEDLQMISDRERNVVHVPVKSQSESPEEEEPLKTKATNGCVESQREAPPIMKPEKYTYMDMWRNVEIRMTSLYLMTIWISWSITYFGIGYNIKNVKGDPYWNVVLLGLTDALGYPASLHITNRIGRRKSVAFFMSWATFFLVTLAVVEMFLNITDGYTWLLLTLLLIGKFGVSGVRGANRTLSGESYPTACRSMGTGLCGVAASIGGIVAPQLAYLGSFWPSLPYFVFAIISIGGAVVSFLLTETLGKPLKEEGAPNSNGNVNGNVKVRSPSVKKSNSIKSIKANSKEAQRLITIQTCDGSKLTTRM